ncbi:unnamed protein product, partial [Allacma fusca]
EADRQNVGPECPPSPSGKHAEQTNFFKTSIDFFYENVRAIASKSTSLLHRLVKEFDSERIITLQDEPIANIERTKQNNTNDSFANSCDDNTTEHTQDKPKETRKNEVQSIGDVGTHNESTRDKTS